VTHLKLHAIPSLASLLPGFSLKLSKEKRLTCNGLARNFIAIIKIMTIFNFSKAKDRKW
jgi:hypothetical protein